MNEYGFFKNLELTLQVHMTYKLYESYLTIPQITYYRYQQILSNF